MKTLGRRLDVLEAVAGDPLSNLSDEELADRIDVLNERIGTKANDMGIALPSNWESDCSALEQLKRRLKAMTQ